MQTKKCLLIDENIDDQEILQLCIRRVNANVECVMANNCLEAYNLVSVTDYLPEYIFLDVNMTKENGLECLRKIRKLDKLNQAKIFMYSSAFENSIFQECKKLGVEDFIPKPTRLTHLKEKLAVIFSEN
jgi:response regulator of citrate/malate metabolism